MEYNKRQFKKTNDKKVLHKIGKSWKTISVALLMAIGGTAVATHANADTIDANTANTNNNQMTTHINANHMSANHSTLVKPQSIASSSAQQSSNATILNKSVSPNSISAKATSIANNAVSVGTQSNNSNNNINSWKSTAASKDYKQSTSEATSITEHIKSDSSVASSYFNRLQPEALSYSTEISSEFTSDKQRNITPAMSTVDSLAEMYSLAPYTASGSNLVLPEISKASNDYTSTIISYLNEVKASSAINANTIAKDPLMAFTFSGPEYDSYAISNVDSLTQRMEMSYSGDLGAFKYPHVYNSLRALAYSAFTDIDSARNNYYVQRDSSAETGVNMELYDLHNYENGYLASGTYLSTLAGTVYRLHGYTGNDYWLNHFFTSQTPDVISPRADVLNLVPIASSAMSSCVSEAKSDYSSSVNASYTKSYSASVSNSYSASYSAIYAKSVNASYANSVNASYSASVNANYSRAYNNIYSASVHINNDSLIANRFIWQEARETPLNDVDITPIFNDTELSQANTDASAINDANNKLTDFAQINDLSTSAEKANQTILNDIVHQADNALSDIMNIMYYPIHEHRFDWNNPSFPIKWLNVEFTENESGINHRMTFRWMWVKNDGHNIISPENMVKMPKGSKGVWTTQTGPIPMNIVTSKNIHIPNDKYGNFQVPLIAEYGDGSMHVFFANPAKVYPGRM